MSRLIQTLCAALGVVLAVGAGVVEKALVALQVADRTQHAAFADPTIRAVLATLERAKMVVEPAGAAAVAAILDDPERFSGPTVGVLSGGNIDPLLLSKVIQHGMAAAGRYLPLRVRIPDRPGGLAQLLTEIGEAGANVIEVAHARIDADLSLDEVEVHLQLETRGESHAASMLARLREAGYRVFE